MLSVKHTILPLLLLLTPALSAQRYFSSVTGGTQHFLNLSVAGGIGLGTTKGDGLSNLVGANGQADFRYEIAKHSVFFNLGVGVEYDFTRRRINSFTDATPAIDPNMHSLTYRYVFDKFTESQHLLSLSVPLQVGYYITNDLYIAVGAKAILPFMGSYNTTTSLYTEGQYENLMQYISRNVPSFGYYPEDTYSSKGDLNISLANTVYVAPGIEFGGLFPIKKRLSCRVALYAEYAVPVISSSVSYDLVDYSAVATQPRTMDNLHEHLAFNPITESRYNASVLDYAGNNVLAKSAQRLAVGVRFTLHLNVSKSPKICNCVKD